MSDQDPDSGRDYTPTDIVYADSSGKITATGRVPAFMVPDQPPPDGGSVAIGKADKSLHYVTGGAIAERPANPSTLSGLRISNVPNPSTVTIDGENPYTVTDGEVDLEFTQPATYTVTVSSWPMLDATFQVTQT